MQHIWQTLCLSIMQSQGNFSNVGNWVAWVITCLHIAWILQILHLSKPFIMTGHVIWCTRINIPYIILCPLFCNSIHHMLHNKQMLFSVFILSWRRCIVSLLQFTTANIISLSITLGCNMACFATIMTHNTRIIRSSILPSTSSSRAPPASKITTASWNLHITKLIV